MKMLVKSKDCNPNYLCTVCKIDNISPIENADKLVKTVINGYNMIIPKTMNVGDIVLYFPVECKISEKILSVNNLYSRDEFERNSNADDVKARITAAEKENDEMLKEAFINEIKSMCGFFNKYGRVRILKLRGQYSQGFIMSPEDFMKAFKNVKYYNWEDSIGEQFDTFNGEIICEKFIPPMKNTAPANQSHWKHRMKKLKRFDRIISDTFRFHYDTTMLAEHIRDIQPQDIITITVKQHGTSGIFANIPVNRKLSFTEKVKRFFKLPVKETEYDLIYSSRSVIKNQYINSSVTDGFYSADIWGCVANVLRPFIPQNYTVYGEICGYIEGSQTFIQKNHDYGCKQGAWKFMPYRISTKCDDGTEFEWNVNEVIEWTNKLMKDNPDIADKIMPMTLLYHGRADMIYPELNVIEHWHENLLEMLKTDAKKDDKGHRGFCMELDEPLCKNKVPREGIVIRIDNDKYPRAWKLKTLRHYGKEAEQHDNGEVDIEETA